MAGHVPAIHVFCVAAIKDVDARDKPGMTEKSNHTRFISTDTFGPFLMV
jgi:hypothetical protein